MIRKGLWDGRVVILGKGSSRWHFAVNVGDIENAWIELDVVAGGGDTGACESQRHRPCSGAKTRGAARWEMFIMDLSVEFTSTWCYG